MKIDLKQNMSDQSSKKMNQKVSEKVNCNVCEKELCKNSIKKHKETCDICERELCKNSKKKHKESEHGGVNSSKKKEIAQKKEEEHTRKETTKDKEIPPTNWSKVWFGMLGDPPLQSTRDIENDMDEYFLAPEEPNTIVSTAEIEHLLIEKDDSLLDVALEFDNHVEGEEDWMNQTNPFASQLGQEMRRMSLQEVQSCKDCKKTTTELNRVRNQYNNHLVHSNKKMKAAEGQKEFLRTQYNLAQNETEKMK